MQARRQTVWIILGVLALGTVLALAFRAYLHPDMLLELTNLVMCT
jgi:hypothetical protein